MGKSKRQIWPQKDNPCMLDGFRTIVYDIWTGHQFITALLFKDCVRGNGSDLSGCGSIYYRHYNAGNQISVYGKNRRSIWAWHDHWACNRSNLERTLWVRSPIIVGCNNCFFELGYLKLPESLINKQVNSKRESLASTFKSVAARHEMKVVLFAFFITIVAFFVMEGTATPWMQRIFGFGPFQTGLIFFYIGMVIAIIQGLVVPKLAKRYSPQSLLMLGITAMASGLAMLGSITTNNLPALVLSSTMIPLGTGFSIAWVNTLVSLKASAHQQGSTLGVTYSVSGIAQIVGPAIGASMFGYGISGGIDGLPFMISATVTILAIIMSIRLNRLLPSSRRVS